MIRRIGAVAWRNLRQLGGDRRAVFHAVLEPILILVIVKFSMIRMQPYVSQIEKSAVLRRYVLTDKEIIVGFIVLMIFFFSYLFCSMTFVRERSAGTLERMLSYPVRRGELVAGYLAGYGAVALVEAGIILATYYALFGVAPSGSLAALAAMVVLATAVAVAISLWASAYCRTEFQAVQFIPLIVLPALLLSGLIFPATLLPEWLQALSYAVPLTYGVEGFRGLILGAWSFQEALPDLAGLAAFVALAFLGGIRTLRPAE